MAHDRNDLPEWARRLTTDPADVARRRAMVVIVARLGSVIALIGASLPIISWVNEGIRDGDLWDMYYYLPRVAFGSTLAAVAVCMGLAAPTLARWTVRVDANPRCPRCGFTLVGLADPRCPECALDFEGREPDRSAIVWTPAAWRTGVQIALRLAALALFWYSTLELISGWAWWASDWGMLDSPLWIVGMFFLAPACNVLLSVLVWVFAPRLADRILRGAPSWDG